MKILPVSVSDAPELLAVYAPYVKDTAVSFEYEVPSLTEFENRIRTISSRYPYLKAVDEHGQILGYSYAGAFHERKAYEWSVESTIYLLQNQRRQGIGRRLYTALENELRQMGVLNVNACIAVPRGEDPHLTMDSFYFHEKMGYSAVGTFHYSGFKFHTWYDMIWMEKMLGEHTETPGPIKFIREQLVPINKD